MISVFSTSRKLCFLSPFRTVLSAIYWVWIIQTQVGALLVWKSTWEKIGHSWTAKKPSFLNGKCLSIRSSPRIHTTCTPRCVSVTVPSAILCVCIWILETQVGALLVWKSKLTWEKGVLCTAKKVPKQKKLRKLKWETHSMIHRSWFQLVMPWTSFPGHNCANGLV